MTPVAVKQGNSEMLLGSYIGSMFRWLNLQGIDTDSVLGCANLDMEQLDTDPIWLSMDTCLDLLNQAREAGWTREMTISMGQSLDLGSHGFLGYAVKASPNLAAALELAVRYFRTRTGLMQISLSVEGEQAVIQLNENAALGDLFPWLMDTLLASIFRACEQLFGGPPPAKSEILLSYPKAPHHQQLIDQTRARLLFDMGVTQIRMPSAWLETRMGSADPSLMKLAASQCEQLLQNISQEADLLDQVRTLAMQYMTSDRPLEAVASSLFMAPRTLRRKLHAQGTSFQQIMEQTRKRLALENLAQEKLSVEQIGLQLGYTDPSNFGRAFRRWTGESPRNWRKKRQR